MGEIRQGMKDYYKEMLDAVRRCVDAEYQIGYGEGYAEAELDCGMDAICRDCAHFGEAVDGDTYCMLHSHKAKPWTYCSWWEEAE